MAKRGQHAAGRNQVRGHIIGFVK